VHSLVVDGERLHAELPELDYRLEHREHYEHPLRFIEDGTPADGEPAYEAFVRFSGAKTTTFIFDAESQRYKVRQFGRVRVDGNDDSPLLMTNVIVIKSEVTPADGGRVWIETTGTGTGYFINGGKFIEINWHRENMDTPFGFTLKDGAPLVMGKGNTYVCIIPLTQYVQFDSQSEDD
jgi:hypothetical protein